MKIMQFVGRIAIWIAPVQETISRELHDSLTKIVVENPGTTIVDVLCQAFALVNLAHHAKKAGKHLGIVSDASVLETEFVGIL